MQIYTFPVLWLMSFFTGSDGCDVGRKQRNSKDEGEIFFILNLSLLTKSWSASCHESFTQFLPVKWTQCPSVQQTSSSLNPVLSWVDELFTDWRSSAEHGAAAGYWKAMANLSPESVTGSVSNTCIIAVNKSWSFDCHSLPMSPQIAWPTLAESRYILPPP